MLASLLPHDEIKSTGDWRRSSPRHTSHKERETRKRADGETFECHFLGGLTLLVFLCPKRCAHMQVSSILVYVCVCVCDCWCV